MPTKPDQATRPRTIAATYLARVTLYEAGPEWGGGRVAIPPTVDQLATAIAGGIAFETDYALEEIHATAEHTDR